VAAFPASSLFALRAVTVRGNHNVPTAEILRQVGIAPGVSAFRVNAVAIRRRLLGDARIADASVALAFPRAVVVAVRERDAVAALVVADGYVLLGADGVALVRAPSPGPALPLEVDGLALPWVQVGSPVPSPQARFGAGVAAALPPALRPEVAGLRVDRGDEVVLQTRDGVAVKVGGAERLDQRLALVPEVLAAVRARGVRAEYVDLRVPGNIIVKPVGAPPAAAGSAPAGAPSGHAAAGEH